MSLKSADEELKKLELCEKPLKELRDRMDEEFSYYRGDPDKYEIPTEEGEWDKIITNRCLVETNRVIDDLSHAARKLWIPIADEDHRDRAQLSATEYTAIGLLYLADSINEDSPVGSDIQGMLAAFRTFRGWSAGRFLLREEDGKIVPDLAVWDPRNVAYIEGRKRLAWVGYTRYATKEQILDEYPGWNGSTDDDKMVAVHDVWDCSESGKPAQEGVIIDKEYVREPEDVKVGSYKLDYIPVRIKAGRSLMLIHDQDGEGTNSTHTDNIKYVGQSFITANRNLYSLESRLLSYQLTRAGELAKAPIIVEFDSAKGPLPPSMEKDPFVKGRVIFLDAAKGQSFNKQLTPPSGMEIQEIYAGLMGLLGIGGLNPVAFGRINTALPAQGIDILSNAALAIEMAFKVGVEKDIAWFAGEGVRQYKLGKFKEMEFEGFDKSNNSFYAKVKPKDINENWKFTCQLIPDLIRDKAAMINIASQAVRDQLLSRQTARDQFQLVTDTDLEETKIAKEQARKVFGVGELEAILAYVKDYAKTKDPETLFILNHAYKNLLKVTQGQSQPTNTGSMPAREVVNNNQMTARRPMTNIPQPIVEAAQMEATNA